MMCSWCDQFHGEHVVDEYDRQTEEEPKTRADERAFRYDREVIEELEGESS